MPDFAKRRHIPERRPDIDAYDTARRVGVRDGRSVINERDGETFPYFASAMRGVFSETSEMSVNDDGGKEMDGGSVVRGDKIGDDGAEVNCILCLRLYAHSVMCV